MNKCKLCEKDTFSIKKKICFECAKKRSLLNSNNWKQKNSQKIKACKVVFCAVRNKTLLKQPCEVCGFLKSEAHHEDYSKPLEINWLCKKHHVEADKLRRLRERGL